MAVGRFRYFSARNSGSLPADAGVRQSSSLVMKASGVRMFSTCVIGDRRREVLRVLERRLAEPGFAEQREVGGVPEVAPVRDVALAHGGAEAVVCVTTQLVSSPPPLPPVTPMRFSSTYPRFSSASTPAIRSL
jgi:hypothetical protein